MTAMLSNGKMVFTSGMKFPTLLASRKLKSGQLQSTRSLRSKSTYFRYRSVREKGRERNDIAVDDVVRRNILETAKKLAARCSGDRVITTSSVCGVCGAKRALDSHARSGFEARSIKTSVPPRITGSHCDTVSPS